ncbi:MAG: hypothetical protein H8E44_19885 [Planctomycetes bacterium]|nr:hypothetical protein [Planctomycetota bacterium]MBL7037828.1 hypothetical protein [Pirellulaceae bacterium]
MNEKKPHRTVSRRELLQMGGRAALGAGLSHWIGGGGSAAAPRDDPRKQEWLKSMTDPFREQLLAARKDLPARVKACAEPLRDEPAFDPDDIARRAAQIHLPDGTRFEHAMLERVVRIGLAHIDATFQGDHPKYGIEKYMWAKCDGFPPIIISAVDALSLWGNIERAKQLMSYWVQTFIYRDGSIQFQGPSLSEYGQLLTTVRSLVERGAGHEWLDRHRRILDTMAGYIVGLATAAGKVTLLAGVPEDDRRHDPATYFHNNAWVVRGLRDWGKLSSAAEAKRLNRLADELHDQLLQAIRDVWPDDPNDWWLPPTVETSLPKGGKIERPAYVTESVISSYTNYRYWPELLSSGVLPRSLAERIVFARLNGGGQFLGMTRYRGFLDDWPLYNWLDGLWQLGRYDDFRLSLWGHIYYSQAEGHLTAYEGVHFPPGRKASPYCLPCQLVAVRAAAKLALA